MSPSVIHPPDDDRSQRLAEAPPPPKVRTFGGGGASATRRRDNLDTAMGKIPKNGIPPLAGLATYEEAARPGYGVDDNVDLLRRYNYVETRLYEMSAAFMNPTPEWEVKCALSLHLYLDGEHGQALRQRVAELRRPPLYLDKSPDAAIGGVLRRGPPLGRDRRGLWWPSSASSAPALLAAYRAHLAAINPLFDFPTARLLQDGDRGRGADGFLWGEACAWQLTGGADAWETHLLAYLAAAGGVDGRGK